VVSPLETTEVVVVPVGQKGSVNVVVNPLEMTIVVCAVAELRNAARSRSVEDVNCILSS